MKDLETRMNSLLLALKASYINFSEELVISEEQPLQFPVDELSCFDPVTPFTVS